MKLPRTPIRPNRTRWLPTDTVVRIAEGRRPAGGLFAFRRPVPPWAAALLGLLCLTLVLGVWWFLTRGPHEERLISYGSLPSPAETYNREQIDRSVVQQCADAKFAGQPEARCAGICARGSGGDSSGRVVRVFSVDQRVFRAHERVRTQYPHRGADSAHICVVWDWRDVRKCIFIFIAVVAFIMMDTASAIADVSSRYIDTAYTLGASRLQIILKVLVPLAMPRLFNSLRLLFGLAFGYIMLTELVTEGGGVGGLGNIINIAQRRGHRETILLVLTVIPAVALAIDRFLYMIQKSLFPHQYGGHGFLHDAWRGLMHLGEDLKQMIVKPTPLQPGQTAALAGEHARHQSTPVTNP